MPVDSCASGIDEEYLLYKLGYRAPGKPPIVIGLMLNHPGQDQLWLEFPQHIDHFVDADQLQVLELLAEDLSEKAEALGPSALIKYLCDTLSNTLLISEPLPISVQTEPQFFLRSLIAMFGAEFAETSFHGFDEPSF